MGFKLRKRQNWLFLPAVCLEVAVERILAFFNVHPLWQALILLVIALFLTIWIVKGNIIFCPWKWSRYVTIKRTINVIEVPEELTEKVVGIPKVEGKTINIPTKPVKERIRIKKKDLYKENDEL